MSDDQIPPAHGLVGSPSDQTADILATGSPPITTLFLSMAERHPEGDDAGYLQWHSLDHRPEQQRLPDLHTSIRVVSTPECRTARAASSPDYDAIDHLMMYFFTDPRGLQGFAELSRALRAAGRSPFVLNPVQRGLYQVSEKIAAPRARIGSDVLPWLPVAGLYILLEPQPLAATELCAVDGVAGVWRADAGASPLATVAPGQQLSCCFLDDDPLRVAQRLTPLLQARWQHTGVDPLLAAPFYAVIPWQWHRYLP